MSERETTETDAFAHAMYCNGMQAAVEGTTEISPEEAYGKAIDFARRLERQRDEFKTWWERDSKSLSVALGQLNTVRAVAEDNRARYVTAERQRDELADMFSALKPIGYAVQMADGAFVGLWRDRETAELVCSKQPPSHGDKVVAVYGRQNDIQEPAK